ncbi:MAG: transporter [Planctomycetes bacterium]|nr:transporter [Planctomycetota bacterium]MBI3843306.1 transporter [Planctomycetota bacterium]
MNRLVQLACAALLAFGVVPVALATTPDDANIDPTEWALLRPFALSMQSSTTEQPTTRVSETTVTADQLDEEHLVGENKQPEWTTHRRFPTTRVYVLPPFAIEFEQWWRARNFRHDSTQHLFQSEIGIGLPYRFQLDYYENFERVPHEEAHHLGSQVEARWAFAEWGAIPGNPTIYGEWKFNDVESDVYELKFLLGDELSAGWHWATNGSFEEQVRDERELEIAVSGALSHTLIDEQLSLGIEGVWRHETANGTRGDPDLSFLIGPSLQWRPTPRTHLDFVPLAGIGGDSPQIETYIVFGWDFGYASKSVEAPTSTRGN